MPEICLAAEQHPSDMQLWDHCGSCNDVPHGGFPTIRHNESQDITATCTLLTEVCHNVATDPPMEKPLTGETLTAYSANTDDNA